MTATRLQTLLAEPIDTNGQCEAVCDELQATMDQLDTATGPARKRLLIRLSALEHRRTALHCGPCFFQ